MAIRLFFNIALLCVCLLAPFAVHAQGAEMLAVDFSWTAPKQIVAIDSSLIMVHNFEGATHLEDNRYLPAKIEVVEGWQTASIEILEMEFIPDSMYEAVSVQEARVIDRYGPVRFFNHRSGADRSTHLIIVPFVRDTSDHTIRIIRSIKLLIHEATDKSQYGARISEGGFNSVLSEGAWYKLAVLKEGVHKIDARFLREMGVDPGSIDPGNIHLYGNGGKMLPQANDGFRQSGLYENSIFVHGENDGRFDDGDYILFFAQDPNTHYWDLESGEFVYENHTYSDTSFYFLTYNSEPGKRMDAHDVGALNAREISVYDDYYIHERDILNILYTGREWYGERMPPGEPREIDFSLPGIAQDSNLNFLFQIMGQTEVDAHVDIELNNQSLGRLDFEKITLGAYSLKGIDHSETFSINSNAVSNTQGNYELSFRFNTGSVSSKAFLNYFIVFGKRLLKVYEDQTLFQSLESMNYPEITYRLSGAAQDISVWEITNPLDPVMQPVQQDGPDIRFGSDSDTLRRFVAFDKTLVPVPVKAEPIENQNLHGQPAPDLLIVCHKDFLVEAYRLASLRESRDGLKVVVATTEEVFNEFSSGSQDVTAIRDYAKYLYDLDETPKLRNLLLLGRGSVDYKDVVESNTNFVPIYCSRNSLHPLKSYASDDFYGFMDDDEGEWQESYGGDHMMDIGVGRFPAKSVEEARVFVDKLYRYASHPDTYGPWRNEVLFVADDGDFNLHQRDADRLAEFVDTTYRAFNVNKIYVDAFEQVTTSIGETSPDAVDALQLGIDKGALIVNFTGHGSETRWTSETILNITMINELDNRERLPLFVTATCEFGRHDDPRIISGGEYLLHNPLGGAIGLVTSSRPVFSSTNYILNEAFYQYVFAKNAGAYLDMGTIFRNTKNASLNGSINRNFSFLGDPSMKLAYPDHHIRIGLDTTEVSADDTLNALEEVKFIGEVVTVEGTLMEGFDGVLTATVFDKLTNMETLGNEGPIMNYKTRSPIFRGEASVTGGRFEFAFIVPKNITYDIDHGKISLYAYNSDRTFDANGSDIEYLVGGSNPDPDPDNQPPDIVLYINDTTFVNGGITGPDIQLLAVLADESGINISAVEPEKGIIARLDDENSYTLNNYYIGDLDTYQSGTVTFPMDGLSKGNHRITVQASDTYNNTNEAEIEFLVVEGPLTIDKLMSYPNPFRDYTRIAFEHNRAGDDLEIVAAVFTTNGQKIKEFKTVRNNAESRVEVFEWNVSGRYDQPMNSGLYILRIQLRSVKDGALEEASLKLVMVN
jgi:hypothetical protein